MVKDVLKGVDIGFSKALVLEGFDVVVKSREGLTAELIIVKAEPERFQNRYEIEDEEQNKAGKDKAVGPAFFEDGLPQGPFPVNDRLAFGDGLFHKGRLPSYQAETVPRLEIILA